MPEPEPQHRALIIKAQHGQRDSLERLISLFHPDIYRLVLHRVGNRSDADDLTQDIFIQMLNKFPDLKNADRFKPWLFRIAVNRVNDHYRKKRLWGLIALSAADSQPPGPAAGDETPATLLLEKEFHRRLHAFVKTLSRGEGEVFLLRFVDRLRIHEIAQVLSKKESTIKTMLYRALSKFKRNRRFREYLAGKQ